MTSKTTVKDIRLIIEQLRAENDPSNAELITFYERKISEVTLSVYLKKKGFIQ